MDPCGFVPRGSIRYSEGTMETQKNSNRHERWVIACVGLLLMVLFQNFTKSDSEKVKRELFSARSVALAQEARNYLSFVEGEDLQRMTDEEILARVRDGMITSAEILKAEQELEPNSNREKKMHLILEMAQGLKKDHVLRQELLMQARSMTL